MRITPCDAQVRGLELTDRQRGCRDDLVAESSAQQVGASGERLLGDCAAEQEQVATFVCRANCLGVGVGDLGE